MHTRGFKIVTTVKSYTEYDKPETFPEWAKGAIIYFIIFHDQVLGLRPHFRNAENFWKGKIYVFRPTRSSGFSSYRVTVKSPGVLLIRTRSLVPHLRQLRFLFC